MVGVLLSLYPQGMRECRSIKGGRTMVIAPGFFEYPTESVNCPLNQILFGFIGYYLPPAFQGPGCKAPDSLALHTCQKL